VKRTIQTDIHINEATALKPQARQTLLAFIFSPTNPRGLWVRYIIAAFLIVGAVTVAHFAPSAAMKEIEEKAAAINVSGKQRMLSQRILFLGSHIAHNPASRPIYIRELEKALRDFQRGHNALLNGGDLDIINPLPKQMQALYFTEVNSLTLNDRIQIYISDGQKIAKSKDDAEIFAALQSLIASGLNLQLLQLDEAVIGYQKYTQSKVDRIRILALSSFILALLVVAFEALFIFLPAHRSIDAALTSAEAHALKLEQNNADLTHFSYVASHDLMAPLRGMTNLVNWIEEDLPESSIEDVRPHTTLLRTRVNRMETLLKDILAFSRAGKVSEIAEDIDLKLLIDEVKAWINIPEGFDVDILGTLPSLHAPRTIIQQCFLNLISNGIKHHDKATGSVKISHSIKDQFHVFHIDDDGPGIPENYHAYVFEMFNRLQTRDEVEGSGIGLAIIKRMIESIDGTIRVAPKPVSGDRGTRFILKLPVAVMTD